MCLIRKKVQAQKWQNVVNLGEVSEDHFSNFSVENFQYKTLRGEKEFCPWDGLRNLQSVKVRHSLD